MFNLIHTALLKCCREWRVAVAVIGSLMAFANCAQQATPSSPTNSKSSKSSQPQPSKPPLFSRIRGPNAALVPDLVRDPIMSTLISGIEGLIYGTLGPEATVIDPKDNEGQVAVKTALKEIPSRICLFGDQFVTKLVNQPLALKADYIRISYDCPPTVKSSEVETRPGATKAITYRISVEFENVRTCVLTTGEWKPLTNTLAGGQFYVIIQQVRDEIDKILAAGCPFVAEVKDSLIFERFDVRNLPPEIKSHQELTLTERLKSFSATDQITVLRELSKRNDPRAISILVQRFSKGQGVEADRISAFALFLELLDHKDPQSLFLIAGHYWKGVGVSLSTDTTNQTVAYLQRSVEAGYVPAMRNYAICLKNGIGGRRDVEAARKLLVQVAKEKDPVVLHLLGRSYLYDSDRNLDLAVEYLTAATKQDPWAEFPLGVAYQYLAQQAVKPNGDPLDPSAQWKKRALDLNSKAREHFLLAAKIHDSRVGRFISRADLLEWMLVRDRHAEYGHSGELVKTDWQEYLNESSDPDWSCRERPYRPTFVLNVNPPPIDELIFQDP